MLNLRCSLLFLLGILSLSACGCGAPKDPLKAFEYKLSTAQTDAAKVRLHSPDGRWQKLCFKVENLLYDVVATDSLASPYTAELSFTASACRTELLDDQSAASNSADPNLETLLPDNYRLSYAYQGGAWKLTSAELSLMQSGAWKSVGDSDKTSAALIAHFQ